MAKVSVNNDPLHERAIFAFDGSSYRAIKIDTDGNLVVAQKADQNIQARSHGYVSSAWQKDAPRLGYSGTQTEQVTSTAVGTGTHTLSSTTVPAGEIWEVQAIHASDDTSTPTRIQITARVTSINVTLSVDTTPSAAIPSFWTGKVILKEGDSVRVFIVGPTNGDSLVLRYHAMRVDIDQ